MKNPKPWDIRERSFQYALQAVRTYRKLQEAKDGAGWVIGKQYLRAATGIGAKIHEAQSAESRADFIHKYGLAQKEARESLYWLQLIAQGDLLTKESLDGAIEETEELIAIITSIIVNTKKKEK